MNGRLLLETITKSRDEILEEWVENLTSGEYKQIQDELKDRKGRGHCCLGVLCETVYGKEVWRKHWMIRERPTGSLPNRIKDALQFRTENVNFLLSSLSPQLVQEILSYFGKHDAEIIRLNDNVCLSHLNDQGVPFSVIAKIIKENPKGMFDE